MSDERAAVQTNRRLFASRAAVRQAGRRPVSLFEGREKLTFGDLVVRFHVDRRHLAGGG